MMDVIRECAEESLAVVRATAARLADRMAEAAETIIASVRAAGGVYVFGNGGSAADAQHIAGELVGRFLIERPAIKAVALTTDTSILTAVSNDYGFDRVFVRQLEALGSPGDVAMALSTSGNSPSIVSALAKAREMGMRTIALTGRGGGRCAELADVLLDVPSDHTPRIQEAHTLVYHIVCQLVESALAES